MNTAKTVNPYKSIARKARFRKLPIVERKGNELVMISKAKDYFEMLIMNQNGSCAVSRVHKDGRRENRNGSWERTSHKDSNDVRVRMTLDNGELMRLCVTSSNVRFSA